MRFWVDSFSSNFIQIRMKQIKDHFNFNQILKLLLRKKEINIVLSALKLSLTVGLKILFKTMLNS